MNLSSPAAVSALLKRHDLRPRRRFGQNFLVDGNTLAKIVAAGQVLAEVESREAEALRLEVENARRGLELARRVAAGLKESSGVVAESSVAPEPRASIVPSSRIVPIVSRVVPRRTASSSGRRQMTRARVGATPSTDLVAASAPPARREPSDDYLLDSTGRPR